MTGDGADFVSVISSDLRGSTTSTQAFPISKETNLSSIRLKR